MEEYNTATFYFKRAEYELAASAFEKILDRYPSDSRSDAAAYWAAESRRVLGDAAGARRLYDRLLAGSPGSSYAPKSQLAAARSAMREREYRQAQRYYAALSESQSSDSELAVQARTGVVESLLMQGDDRGAEPALRRLLSMERLPRVDRLGAELRLRRVLVRLGREAESLAMHDSSKRGTPHYQAEEMMMKAEAAAAAGRAGVAAKFYEKVSVMEDLPPEFRAEAAYRHAQMLTALGEPERAYDLYHEISTGMDALPDILAGAGLQLSYLYRSQAQSEAADASAKRVEKIAEESGRRDLKNEAVFFRAEEAFRKKNPTAALALLGEMNEDSYRVNRLTGQIHLESGRHADAIVYLERAAGYAPDESARNESLLDLARSHFAGGAYESVLTALSRLRQAGPDARQKERPMLAESLYRLGRYKEAGKIYGDLAKGPAGNPETRQYRYYAVLSNLRDKNPAWADRLLKDLEEVGGVPSGPESDPGLFLDAAVEIDNAIEFSATGKEEDLRRQLDAQLGRFNGASYSLGLYLFAIDKLASKNRHGLVPRYTQSLLGSVPPEEDFYGRAAYAEVRAYDRLKQPVQAMKTLEVLEKWVTVRRSSDLAEDARYLRAKFSKEAGDEAAARRGFQAYLETYPEGKYVAEAYFQLGTSALEGSQLAEAEKAFEKLASAAAESSSDGLAVQAKYRLALIRLEQKRYADAAALMSPLAEITPYRDDPDFRGKLAESYLALGNWPAADPHIRYLVEHPKTPAARREWAIVSYLRLLDRGKQTGKLEQEFRRYANQLKTPSLVSEANFLVGMTHFDGERYAEASKYFEAVKEGGDIVKDALLRRADCAYHERRYADAEGLYNRVVRSWPRTPWARDSLFAVNLCKIQQGQREDALEGLERFLEQNPDATLAPSAALEAAELYLKGGDLEAVDRKIKYLESRPSKALAQRFDRLRMEVLDRRGQTGAYFERAKDYLKTYGMNLGIAISAAVAGTRLGYMYDPFDLSGARDIAGALSNAESRLSQAGVAYRTFPIEERFHNSRGMSLDFEEVYCTLRRVIFTEPRVYLVVEAKSVSFTAPRTPFKVRNIAYAGEDIVKIPGTFLSGIRMNEEEKLASDQPKYFMISMPRPQWSDNGQICLDGVGFRPGWYCYSHTAKKGVWTP
ncbi:tetratricopeptide repeat protein [bacterium]|nr:tetratricopeptide repeat protein [bacterium]